MAINFLGGEPLCDPDLPALMAHIPPAEAVSVVTTNGVLLDAAMLDRLIEAGLGILAVSLDDPDPEAHDAFRGRAGTFAAATAALTQARRRGVTCVINSILTEASLLDGRAARLVDLARRYGAEITVNLPIPVGRWAKNGPTRLSPAAEEAMARLKALRHVRWDGQSNYLRPGCVAGTEKLAISAYGDVLPCGVIQLSYGNLRERPLRDIWRDLRSQRVLFMQGDHCPFSDDSDSVRHILKAIESSSTKPLPVARFLEQKKRREAGKGG